MGNSISNYLHCFSDNYKEKGEIILNKKVFSRVLVLVSIFGFILCSNCINTKYTYEDWIDGDHYFSTNELGPGQTWPDFWQARVNNPYARPHELAVAKWVVVNGYSDCDVATAYAAYEEANSASSSNDNNSSDTPQNINNEPTTSRENNAANVFSISEEKLGIYVVLSKKAVYSSYNSGKEELGSLSKGTEVEVTGNTSNGYYRFTYTTEDGSEVEAYLLYKGKDNIVDKDTYDAAWELTNTVDATCTKDGYVEYTNSLSGLTKRDKIKSTGHVLGDEELIKEPGLFSKGEIATHCAVCGEIIR